jgi:hypothetical protein
MSGPGNHSTTFPAGHRRAQRTENTNSGCAPALVAEQSPWDLGISSMRILGTVAIALPACNCATIFLQGRTAGRTPAHHSLLLGVGNMSLRYMSLAILLLLVIGVDAPAHATTHFVASTRTDSGACTRTAPCSSIAQAVANAFPNDTVVCVDTVSGSTLLCVPKT